MADKDDDKPAEENKPASDGKPTSEGAVTPPVRVGEDGSASPQAPMIGASTQTKTASKKPDLPKQGGSTKPEAPTAEQPTKRTKPANQKKSPPAAKSAKQKVSPKKKEALVKAASLVEAMQNEAAAEKAGANKAATEKTSPKQDAPKKDLPAQKTPKQYSPKQEEPKKEPSKPASSGRSAVREAMAAKLERPTPQPEPRQKKPKRPRSERPERPKREKKRRGLFGRLMIGAVKAVLFLGFLAGLGASGFVALYVNEQSQNLPDYSLLEEYEPPIMTRVHAGDGTLIAEYANERRLFVPIGQVPDHVIHAFVAAEDQNFYTHPGVDWRGILRAAIANVFNYFNDRRLEGASTITQQVAKNFLLSSEVSIDRKVREALLAMRIEETLSKDEILELYLNQIYLGWRSYGIAAAALNYFNKSLEELTVAEAAYLAVMPKAPNNYRPDRESTRARSLERRDYVLNRMAADGYITQAQAREAQREELVVFERPAGAQVEEAAYFAEEVRRRMAAEFGYSALLDGGLSVRTTVDMELQIIARNALRNGLFAYDQRHGWRGPEIHLESLEEWQAAITELELPRDLAPWFIAIVTAVDDELGWANVSLGEAEDAVGIIPLSELAWAREQAANRIDIGGEITAPSQVLSVGDVVWVEEVVVEFEEEDGPEIIRDGEEEEIIEPEPVSPYEGLSTFGLRQVPAVNGGIMAMDPHTGRVLAMVGGFSFDASEFNRATQAWRQPGSSFKPFVYAAALDMGRTPSDLILDAPFVMPQGEGLPLWRPDNYTDRFYGPSTLRVGVERSRNAMTVRLAQDIGMERVVDLAIRFGVVDHMQPYLAFALGAGETTIMRMVAAYSQFVNGGRRIHPYFVERVQDRYGHTLSRQDERECAGCLAEEWTGQAAPVLPDEREVVLDPRTAYQVVSILEGVVQRGTGRSLRSVGVPLGGKTGTTNDFHDAWFMGISPDLVVGAYVGHDIPYKMGRGETGGRVAAPIVREFFTHTVGTRPPIPFRRPAGIRIVRVNVETGQLAQPGDLNVIEEAFRPGTEPSGELSVIGVDGFLRTDEEDDLRSGSGGLY